MRSRFTPSIRFVLDEGVKKSIEVTRLIREALAESKPAGDDQADSAAGTAEEGEADS
jgi:ribosome-binding factor A